MILRRYLERVSQSAHIFSTLIIASFFAIFSIAPAVAAAQATSPSNVSNTKPQISAQADMHNTMSPVIAGKAQKNTITPNIAWSASLTTSTNLLWPTQSATLTATANQNVGPTPYYLSIYDQTAAHYIAICGSGTTCMATVTQSQPTTHYYEAFVALYPPTTGMPSGIQATSNSVGVVWQGTSVTLAASPTTLPLNGVTTLTATAGTNVGPTPFWIEIFDTNTGVRIGVCGSGTTCTATESQAVATTHKFVAYISGYSTTFPPANTIETSTPVFVTWGAGNYRVSLSGTGSIYSGSETLTATSNVNVGPTPYWIEIYNLDTGTRLGACGTGTTCTLTASKTLGLNHYVAFISSYSTALPPAGTQASSNVVSAWYRIIP